VPWDEADVLATSSGGFGQFQLDFRTLPGCDAESA